MIKKLKHYIDIAIYLMHKYYWDLCAHFGNIHGIVLMYHYITDEHINTLANCQHTPAVFEATLKRLMSEGYSFVSLDEMIKIIESKGKKKFAVITFDDIMDNVFTCAYPILKQYQIPFTLFVATGLIDTKDYITLKHLKEMDQDSLCIIGAHTVTHCRLRKVAYSKEELLKSKQQLEDMLGHKIHYLAYPYGWHCDVSKKNMKEAQSLGYKCAFGTIQSPVSDISANKMFYLPRMVLKG